jgi:hypothetical protein
MNIDDVKQVFTKEFGVICDKFDFLTLSIGDAFDKTDEEAGRPGVYFYWHPKYDVIVVGKSQSNSKKRALQHIRDNTRNDVIEMQKLKDDPDLILALVNVANSKYKHWVLSLEAFFEWNLNPTIKAARMG